MQSNEKILREQIGRMSSMQKLGSEEKVLMGIDFASSHLQMFNFPKAANKRTNLKRPLNRIIINERAIFKCFESPMHQMLNSY